MKRFIWALALMVMLCGTTFAIGNASGTEETQSGWSNTSGASVSITTEGGKVSNVTIGTGTSTARWAGAYGAVTGNIVLAESGESNFMYTWTVSAASLGEVCVSQEVAPAWASLAVTTAAEVDGAFGFSTGDDQAQDFFTNGAVRLDIGGIQIDTTGATTTAGWEFGAANLGATAAEDDFVFCGNISQTDNNYAGNPVDFELMFPTTTEAADTYYFYVELV